MLWVIHSTGVCAEEPGATLYATHCSACHGVGAQGNPQLGSPALAGQHASYLERQLHNFANGIRGADGADSYGKQMAASSSLIAESEWSSVSTYLATLEPSSSTASDGDTVLGYKVFQGTCSGCHGAEGQGNPALHAPRIAGLAPDYLLRQFKHFQTGVRGANPEDRYGRQMAMMASTIRDPEQVSAIIAFLTAK
ncbi:cytochrome c [Arenicella chitinivorans]|uniref:cytochrome c n=1 Tax=Arenicella chitinivorans TaxID=1329800 RepID=UPI001677BADB|nr:cytochrome c [Arenicella chitinivorans]